MNDTEMRYSERFLRIVRSGLSTDEINASVRGLLDDVEIDLAAAKWRGDPEAIAEATAARDFVKELVSF